jgi:hypothetical protein
MINDGSHARSQWDENPCKKLVNQVYKSLPVPRGWTTMSLKDIVGFKNHRSKPELFIGMNNDSMI